jgi:hypothetical protein
MMLRGSLCAGGTWRKANRSLNDRRVLYDPTHSTRYGRGAARGGTAEKASHSVRSLPRSIRPACHGARGLAVSRSVEKPSPMRQGGSFLKWACRMPGSARARQALAVRLPNCVRGAVGAYSQQTSV